MTQTEALAAIETLVKEKKISKSSLAYKTIIAAINNPGVPQVCGKNTGRGRHSSSTSWQDSCIWICSLSKINVTPTNESPQGGKHGDRITITF